MPRSRTAGWCSRTFASSGSRRELELAHDLQLKLLPSPAVLQGDAQVAAICRPVDSVGGDFYTFNRLGNRRVGVMLGDVSSHGFSAALVMALVMSAAGIHAGAANTPDETLAALLESLGPDLATTEMFLSVFYGVLDPRNRRLTYANAGHQHAFRLPKEGQPERLAYHSTATRSRFSRDNPPQPGTVASGRRSSMPLDGRSGRHARRGRRVHRGDVADRARPPAG